jgi:hypothetical protein
LPFPCRHLDRSLQPRRYFHRHEVFPTVPLHLHWQHSEIFLNNTSIKLLLKVSCMSRSHKIWS